MSYDKAQATREFRQWSVGYDRSILQWLLFGPAHRAIIGRLRTRFAGHSSICDGRFGLPVVAGTGAQLLLSEITVPEPHKNFA